MGLFIPTWLDLAGWAGALVAAAALIGVGRLLVAGRATPEAALIAGWGAAALVLTLWGVASPASLRWPGVAILVMGACGLVAPRSRLTRGEWRGIGRIAVLALPLLAVLASARPAEPDTFLNLLPNAAYLYDHGFFPGDGRPPAHSFLPAAPYNLQLASFLGGLVAREFPANGLIAANVVFQLAASLLLARLVAGTANARAAPPSWGACAAGLLLATALNPGFVPRYHLSGYSEPSVAVALAFAGYFAADALGAGDRQRARTALTLLALALAALVNVKQDSVALVLGLLATAALLALRGAAPRRDLAGLALAAVPAMVLYLAWRWYVATHLAAGELQPLPLESWQPGALPLILWHMLGIMAQKVVFYAVLVAALAASWWRWRRHGIDLAVRVGALLGGCFVLYSAALVFAYVALFPGTMGSDAHSYFRYSTHLALLLMVAIALLGRAAADARGWSLASPVAQGALAAAILASPVAFLPLLRFDLEPPALRVWALAGEAAPLLGEGERVALILPGDNGSVAAMLETALRDVPPRRRDLDLTVAESLAPDTLDAMAAKGYAVALLSCAPAGFAAVPPGSAALLRHDNSGWHAAQVWHYDPPRRHRWSHVLADAPLCLG